MIKITSDVHILLSRLSSAERAFDLHSKGQGFDSLSLYAEVV